MPPAQHPDSQQIIPKPSLHKDWIDPHAFGIVKALQKAGHTTYLVGGCVRDLLLGIHPKDYDIATQAHPPQVKRVIYMSYIIGRRFRLVLVKRDDQQFEVATFRSEANPEDIPEGQAAPVSDNVFGTPEEDARRRDFTINALFYDPIGDELIDYVGGLEDIQKRVVRMIGEPNARLVEDSIRILRAMRLTHKLHCSLDPDLRAAIVAQASSLAAAKLPRKREEILKILRLDQPELCLLEAFDLGVLQYTIPSLHELFLDPSRQELFLQYIRIFRPLIRGKTADPAHLFGWFLLAFYRTVAETSDMPDDVRQRFLANEINLENDSRFLVLMRDELGMFKFEQALVADALRLSPQLARAEEFKRRGERRQFALLKQECFLLGMLMAQVDFQVSAEVLLFWREAYERAREKVESVQAAALDKVKSSKRRRRKPRRDRGAGDSRIASDSDGARTSGRRADSADDASDEDSGDDDSFEDSGHDDFEDSSETDSREFSDSDHMKAKTDRA